MVDKTAAGMLVVMLIVLIISILGVTGVFSGFGGFGGGDVTEKPCNLPGVVCAFGSAIGFPQGWLRTDTFIWYCFIPLTGVWMIIFGFLDRIKIFKGSINAVLSFLIAFSMIPLGIFVILVSLLFGIMGTYSTFLFVGLFFVGTILYSKGLIFGWRGQFGSYAQSLLAQEKLKGELDNKINTLTAEFNAAGGGGGAATGRYATMGAAERDAFIQRVGKEIVEARKQKAAAEAAIDHYKRASKYSKKVFQRIQQT
jgi:hypothetical protein